MRVVIATFEQPRHSEAFSRALRDDFGVPDDAIGEARVAAYGEPHDGHRLVAAWVPRGLSEAIRACATHFQGVLHEPPAPVTRPVAMAASRSATAHQVGRADGLGEAREPGTA